MRFAGISPPLIARWFSAAILRSRMKNTFRKIVIAAGVSLALTAAAKDSWNNIPKRAEPDIQHGTFHSTALKTDVGYNICLPLEYSTKTQQRFPVIYYLHGYEGNESSYLAYAKY